MKFEQVSESAVDVLEFLSKTELKPDEQIAVLKTAASAIEHTLSSEMIKTMFVNILKK